MIICRTKGIPMREGTRVDAEGHHIIKLDEAKHDPFTVVDRLMAAAGAQDDPEANARYERVMTAQRLSCLGGTSCESHEHCSRSRCCRYRLAQR